MNEDKSHHSYAFLPFGYGHRQCMGQNLARFELKVILARLMQHVTFGDGGPEVNAGGYLTRLTMMPKHVGVTIDFDSISSITFCILFCMMRYINLNHKHIT